jgi:hypothetical protein
MTSGPFLEFYTSDLQATYSLWVVPILFLAYLLTTGRRRADASSDPAARFVWTYSVVFAVETILDSFATGPLSRWLGMLGTSLGTAVLLTFVLLGDFRVLLLVFRLARPTARWLVQAVLWTFVVPIFAYVANGDLHSRWPTLPDQTIWLLYELGFLALALVFRSSLVPRWTSASAPGRLPFLRAVLAYVAVYYALWVTADVIILVADLDVGWGLRVIPNQLYYSFFLPFVFWRFFREDATVAGRKGPAPLA